MADGKANVKKVEKTVMIKVSDEVTPISYTERILVAKAK
jgi:hypothetical protein